MNYICRNTDKLDPAALAAAPLTHWFFADTRMSVRHQVRNDNPAKQPHHHFMLFSMDYAMEGFAAGVAGDEGFFVLDFAQAGNDVGPAFEKFFGRFPRFLDLYKSLEGIRWISRNQGPMQSECVLTRDGTIMVREHITTDRIFSPFVRLPCLDVAPAKWTPLKVVQILSNGQYSLLRKISPGPAQTIDRTELEFALVQDAWRDWHITADSKNGKLHLTSTMKDVHAKLHGSRVPDEIFEIVPDFFGGASVSL